MKRTAITLSVLTAIIISIYFNTNLSHAQTPVVNAVFFYSPYCGHCITVINEILPTIQAKYLEGLNILQLDITQPEEQQLYQAAITQFKLPDDRLGVPALVIGTSYLLGEREIREQLPGVIENGLSSGGIIWPQIPGLDRYISRHHLQSDDPSVIDNMAASFKRDRVGNSLAVIVLLGMIFSVVWVGISFVLASTSNSKPWPQWIVPTLAVIGLVIAIYLTYIETTQSQAFCGPVGDCNSVQQSPYAKLFGLIPIGILGMVGYFTILAVWVASIFLPETWRKLSGLALWILAWVGILFSIYLTFLEPFVIGATCMWCISSAIIITLLLWATTPLAKMATQVEDDLDDGMPDTA